MGIAAIGLIVSAASAAVSTYGAVQQAKAEQKQAYQQEVELNKIAASEASDAVDRADKRAAEAMAAMEAMGGFGSYNDERLQLEMAGLKGLDLARIESNRSRQAAQLYAARKSLANSAVNSTVKGIGQVAGSVANYYGQMGLLKELRAGRDEELANVSNLGLAAAQDHY